MALGFTDRFDFTPVVGWELYQVTLDKYHVMFWFQNGHALLNVAGAFAFRTADGSVVYKYDLYGEEKFLNLDRILRVEITDVRIVSREQLDLKFSNGDILSIFDAPEFRSWWFCGGFKGQPQVQISDLDPEDMNDEEEAERQARLQTRTNA